MVHDLAAAPDFGESLRALESRRFSDGAAITAPVTIAFGSRDMVMLPGIARQRDQLPEHTRWVTMPKCGHLQVFDDPDAVVELLLAATETPTAGHSWEPRSGDDSRPVWRDRAEHAGQVPETDQRDGSGRSGCGAG